MVFTSKVGVFERAHTSRHPSVFGKRLPDDKLSHLRVEKGKKLVLTALWHSFRGGHGLSALYCRLLDPFDGTAEYMSWHFTERLSAPGFRQHVLVDLQTGLICLVGGKCSFYF